MGFGDERGDGGYRLSPTSDRRSLSQRVTSALGSDDWLIVHDGHHLVTAEDLDRLNAGSAVAPTPPCGCSCHTVPGTMHVAACCGLSGLVSGPTDLEPRLTSDRGLSDPYERELEPTGPEPRRELLQLDQDEGGNPIWGYVEVPEPTGSGGVMSNEWGQS